MEFSEDVIQNAAPYWERATNHDFISKMVDGTLDKDSFATYLVQDYVFVNSFLSLVSYSIAYAKTIEQKHRLSSFLSMVTSDENSYFIRSFEELGVPESEYLADDLVLTPALQGFKKMIHDAINSDGENAYAHCLIILVCAETVYCEWGVKHQSKKTELFYFDEWITLHNNEFFQSFASWLRSELDKLGSLPERNKEQLRQQFKKMCQLEAQFF